MHSRTFSAAAAMLVAVALALPPSAPARAQAKPPTVVELFTSQGCNSCPPADAYLGELAQRDDVLALSMHIDYWDYLGWKDTFSSAFATERQRAYSRALGKSFVYTPQMVVGGVAEAMGSRRHGVEPEIDPGEKVAYRHAPAPLPVWAPIVADRPWRCRGEAARME